MKSPMAVAELEVAKHDGGGGRLADRREPMRLLTAFDGSGPTQQAFVWQGGMSVLRRGLAAAAPVAGGAPGGAGAGVCGGEAAAGGVRGGGVDAGRRDRAGGPDRGCSGVRERVALMFAFPGSCRVYLAVEPVNMRKHFDGLWSEVEQRLGEDPRQGALFVFSNKDRNRLNLLYWDGSGVWVLAKQLEKGRFTWPVGRDARKLSRTTEALTMLIGGIDLKDGCRKAWYER